MPRSKCLTITAHCATFFGGILDNSTNFLQGNFNGKLITAKGNTNAVASMYDLILDLVLQFNSMLKGRGPHVPLFAFYCVGRTPILLPTAEESAKSVYLGGITGPIVLILSYQNQVYNLGMEFLIQYGIRRMAPLRQEEVPFDQDVFGDELVALATVVETEVSF